MWNSKFFSDKQSNDATAAAWAAYYYATYGQGQPAQQPQATQQPQAMQQQPMQQPQQPQQTSYAQPSELRVNHSELGYHPLLITMCFCAECWINIYQPFSFCT